MNEFSKAVKDKLLCNCVLDILFFMANGKSGGYAAPILIEKYGIEMCYRALFRIEELFE